MNSELKTAEINDVKKKENLKIIFVRRSPVHVPDKNPSKELSGSTGDSPGKICASKESAPKTHSEDLESFVMRQPTGQSFDEIETLIKANARLIRRGDRLT